MNSEAIYSVEFRGRGLDVYKDRMVFSLRSKEQETVVFQNLWAVGYESNSLSRATWLICVDGSGNTSVEYTLLSKSELGELVDVLSGIGNFLVLPRKDLVEKLKQRTLDILEGRNRVDCSNITASDFARKSLVVNDVGFSYSRWGGLISKQVLFESIRSIRVSFNPFASILSDNPYTRNKGTGEAYTIGYGGGHDLFLEMKNGRTVSLPLCLEDIPHPFCFLSFLKKKVNKTQ